MKKIIINQNQKGLLFKNGKYVQLLTAGKYYIGGGKSVEILDESNKILSEKSGLDILLKDEAIANNVTLCEVPNDQLALHFVNGQFENVLRRGKHAFWNSVGEHTFQMVDLTNPQVSEDVPEYVFEKIPKTVNIFTSSSNAKTAVSRSFSPIYLSPCLFAVLSLAGSAVYTPSMFFAKSNASAPISLPRNTAAVSVEK